MKKILSFAAAAVLCFALVACGGKSSDDYLGYTFEFDVPEGFSEVAELPEGVSGFWQAEDGSNITVVAVENDGSLASDVPGDQMKQLLEENYISQLGEGTELSDFAFESTEVDGCPAYKMSFTVTFNGISIDQTTVGVNGDKAYTYTFTDTTGGEWKDAFAASVGSMTAVSVE